MARRRRGGGAAVRAVPRRRGRAGGRPARARGTAGFAVLAADPPAHPEHRVQRLGDHLGVALLGQQPGQRGGADAEHQRVVLDGPHGGADQQGGGALLALLGRGQDLRPDPADRRGVEPGGGRPAPVRVGCAGPVLGSGGAGVRVAGGGRRSCSVAATRPCGGRRRPRRPRQRAAPRLGGWAASGRWVAPARPLRRRSGGPGAARRSGRRDRVPRIRGPAEHRRRTARGLRDPRRRGAARRARRPAAGGRLSRSTGCRRTGRGGRTPAAAQGRRDRRASRRPVTGCAGTPPGRAAPLGASNVRRAVRAGCSPASARVTGGSGAGGDGVAPLQPFQPLQQARLGHGGRGQQHPRAQQLQQQPGCGGPAHLDQPGVHDLAVAGQRGRAEPVGLLDHAHDLVVGGVDQPARGAPPAPPAAG